MQSLDIISVNLWQILISLCNLLILFLILKKFLYKPVKKVLANRQSEVDKQYQDAEQYKNEAIELKNNWQQKMDSAKEKADSVIKEATTTAQLRHDNIIDEANEKANRIVTQAQEQAQLEQKKIYSEIKHDVVDISTMITEKMLNEKMSDENHHDLIDMCIEELGDNNE